MRLLPVEYLPDDYNGPNAGTEKELIGDDNHAFFQFFGHHLQTCSTHYSTVKYFHFLRILSTATHILCSTKWRLLRCGSTA